MGLYSLAMAKVPKAKNQYDAMDSGVHSTKADIIEKAGFTVKQVQRFETLAKNRDAGAKHEKIPTIKK